MTSLLAQLPREIITYHLEKLLSPRDIASLYCACGWEASEELYNRLFDDDVRLDKYGTQILLERASSRLYVFGYPIEERFIRSFGHIPTNVERSDGCVGVYTPSKMDTAGDNIVKVATAHLSLLVLKPEGQLSYTDYTDFSGGDVLRKFKVSGTDRRVDRHDCPKIVSAARSTLCSILAVDSEGLVWEQYSEREGAHQISVVMDGKAVEDRAFKVKGGHRFNSCLFENRGIVCWNQARSNIYGHPAFEGMVVPNTLQNIRDWVVLEYAMVCLSTDGRVTLMDLLRREECAGSADKVNNLGKVVQISGMDRQFVLLFETGEIVVADPFHKEGPRVLPTSPIGLSVINTVRIPGVVSVSAGKSHFLALTNKGEVYSWGTERDLNGCLGLGKADKDTKVETKLEVDWHGNTLGHKFRVQEKPAKVDLPGKVYGVFAGDNYSAVLVYES